MRFEALRAEVRFVLDALLGAEAPLLPGATRLCECSAPV